MPLARQPAHRVIGVDPRVHARRGRQLRPRRTQLRRDHRQTADSSCSTKRAHGRPLILSVLTSRLPCRPWRSLARLDALPRVALCANAVQLPSTTCHDSARPLAAAPASSCRQARRCDSVRVRRQQGPQARSSWRRTRSAEGADTLITCRRRPVESRARDGRGGRPARPALRPRRQRHAAGDADRQRAARSAARRRGALRRDARRARARRWSEAAEQLRATGRQPFVIPLGASTPLGAAGVRAGGRRAARRRSTPPDVIVHADLVGRHAGRARSPAAAARARHARHRHQRRRSVADAGSPRDPPNPRGPRGAARGDSPGRSRTPRSRSTTRSSATATASRHRGSNEAIASVAPGARRCSSTRPIRPRRWPGLIARVRARARLPAAPCCSGTPADRWGFSVGIGVDTIGLTWCGRKAVEGSNRLS